MQTLFYGTAMTWKQWDAMVAYQKYESRSDVSSPPGRRSILTSLQANARRLPQDVKKVWGFDGSDIEKAAFRVGNKTNWLVTLRVLREEFRVTDRFDAFCQETLESELDVLQNVLRQHNPSSTMLELALRDRMTDDELPEYLSKYSITLEDLDQCFSQAIEERTSMRALASLIGDERWKALSNRGMWLQKMLVTIGKDLNQIEWWKSTARAPRKRQPRVMDDKGIVSIQYSKLKSARSLSIRHQAELFDNHTYSLMTQGEPTMPHTLHLSRMRHGSTGWTSEEYSREIFGRFIPIKLSLKHLTDELKRDSVLLPNVNRLRYSIWIDGSTLGRLSTVLVRYRLLYEPGILVSDEPAKIEKLRAIQTWISIPIKESYDELYPVLRPLLESELLSLKDETDISFQMILFLADNKCHQLSNGIANGKFPCNNCYSARDLFGSLSSQYLAVPRSPSNSLQRIQDIADGLPLLKFGDFRKPLFVSENGDLFVEPLLDGVDPLHVVETPGLALLNNCLRIAKPFLYKETVETLVLSCHGRSLIDFDSKKTTIVSKTDVRSIRELYMLADVSFLSSRCWIPASLLDEGQVITGTRIRVVLSTMRDIICLMYAPLLSRSPVQILAIHVLTFSLSKQLSMVFLSKSDPIYSLPLHQLLNHLPTQSRYAPLMELSTEDFEALWKWLKLIQKHHSNGSDDPASGWHIRTYHKEKLNRWNSSTVANGLADNTSSHRVEELCSRPYVLPAEVVDEDFALLAYRIRDFHFCQWYDRNSDGSVTFHFDRSHQISRPTIQWYPSHSQLILHLDEFAIGNPAISFWRESDIPKLQDSLLSWKTDFIGHPASDLRRAIDLRSTNASRYDRRTWLTTSGVNVQLTKEQLLERLVFDNQVLQVRDTHPAPSVVSSAREKQNWKKFLEEEDTRLESLGIVPNFSARENLGKRARVDDPRTWQKPELKKRCLSSGVPIKDGPGCKEYIKSVMLEKYIQHIEALAANK